MSELFVYGTLMFEDIMRSVAGPCRRLGDATLPGHRRLAVRGEHYPGVVEAPGHGVAGVLYGGLSRRALAHLDRFEGAMYRRVTTRVLLPDGQRRQVFTYLVKETHRHHLEPREWDPEAFLATGKGEFQRRYTGFGRT